MNYDKHNNCIYDKHNNCIVTIITKIKKDVYSYGSGFLISNDGYIVTSGHNCIECELITVLHNNSLHKSNIIGIDKRTDIGILKIKIQYELQCLNFADYTKISSGDVCYILGNHADSAQCICHIGNIKFTKYLSNEVFESIVVDVNVNQGTSGSPILDTNGDIIGMINWFMDRDCSGGVTSKYIKTISTQIINGCFEKSHIGFKTKQLKLQDIIEHNISMVKRKVRGEIIIDEFPNGSISELQKNDIIIEINNEDVGVLDSNIESIVYNLPHNSEVEVKYYKYSPENGMSWTTHECLTIVNLVKYPESDDKAILKTLKGREKIKLS